MVIAKKGNANVQYETYPSHNVLHSRDFGGISRKVEETFSLYIQGQAVKTCFTVTTLP
jgi:hypothetical protein